MALVNIGLFEPLPLKETAALLWFREKQDYYYIRAVLLTAAIAWSIKCCFNTDFCIKLIGKITPRG